MTAPTWVSAVDDKRPIIGLPEGVPHQTFPAAIAQAVRERGHVQQYFAADGSAYTLAEFYDMARKVAKAMIHLGLQPFDGVSILGFNSLQWFAADVGATLAGCLPAGIYTTNKPAIVAYIIKHSRSRVILVDDETALEKVLSVVDQCPELNAVVVWGSVDQSKYSKHADLVHTFDQFLALSEHVPDSDLDARIDAQSPENVCKLIYTSGTTGPPKAVMISHDNIVFTAIVTGRLVNAGVDDHLVSFLPCSHIAANMVDIAGSILRGIKITFGEPDALKGSLVKTLKKVRPTLFLAVPRVFEKIQEKLLQIGAENGPIKRAISSWAKSIGTAASHARDGGDELMPWGYKLAKLLVFNNVAKALGLDSCRLIFNAAAPLQKATESYFKSLDIRIHDIYGMSEGTGPITANVNGYKAGTSGKMIPGGEVKLINKDETGEGELCFRGRNVFVGYLDNPEETSKTIDEDGFIHSGDLGRVDEDGYVSITGRVKELIVTAGGENVAPALTEGSLGEELNAISRVFVVGDKKKFISCLLIPYIDEEGNLIGPASTVNPNVKTAVDAVNDPVWLKYINEGVERANTHAISNAAKVRKFRLLSKDFTVEGGELTPTMKVKRKIVVQKYDAVIDEMYS
ncbi:long-chain-fatty-acid-CoA ligase [Gracilaria domingensis]|nr:long-chain-fatty-acid-CoA ligase [Gracilaria domingensis]